MAPESWTGKRIVRLWGVVVGLLAGGWIVVLRTDLFPATVTTFLALWLLTSVGPAVLTWRWARASARETREEVSGEASEESSEEAE